MIDEANSLLTAAILLLGCGMWPVAFLFAGCSPCCGDGDSDGPCPWVINFTRCLRVTHVGTDPLVGGDCRLVPVSGTSSGVRVVRAGPIEILNVQSSIRIPIRATLSASGASRTPVGETRTQVWRFNVARPSVLTGYDVVGPPWHLQVDLSVTGVETEEEAGVQSAIETDEHGQPKLVLTVNQWTATITHDEEVTIAPVGLQRWVNGQLTSSFVAATLVSGSSVSGWFIDKITGITALERGVAVAVFRSSRICAAASVVSPAETITGGRVLLDESAAAAFLNGENDLRVTTDAGERDLRVTPDNILCELSRSLVGIGVAVGAYPNEITATPQQSYAASAPFCQETVSIGLRPSPVSPQFTQCSLTWERQHDRLGAIEGVSPSDFWPGLSLLWNLENEPYRRSFTRDAVTYDLDGAGNNVSQFLLSPPAAGFPCREPIGEWCREGEDFVSMRLKQNFAIYRYRLPEGHQSVLFCDAVPAEVIGFFSVDEMLLLTFFGSGQYALTTSYPITVTDESLPPGIYLVQFNLNLEFTTGCPDALSPPAVTRSQISINGFSTVPALPIDFGTADHIDKVCTIGKNIIQDPAEYEAAWNLRPRVVCGAWTPQQLPAAGGTLTKNCETTDGQTGFSASTQTLSVPASRSRLPQAVANGDVIQSGRCRLLSVRDFAGTTVLQPTVSLSQSATASGLCLFYQPLFGALTADGNVCGGDITSITPVPCDSCVASVTITAGEENATVTAPTSGDKAGLIEVAILRDWRGGEGVTFTITCGNDTITQRIQRQTSVPEAPINLTATRGPCSQATLAWEAPHDGGSPITGYIVERRVFNGGNYESYSLVSGTSLSASVFGLLRLGYQFRVAAINALGTGAYSNIAVVDGFTLGAPTNLAVTRAPCDTANLTWTAPTQSECVVVASYRLEYRNASGGSYTLGATVASTATSGSISGLPTNVRLQFRVGRVDDANTTVYSGTVISGNTPFTPTGVTATLGENAGEVNLTWNAQETECFENTDYNIQIFTTAWADFPRDPSAAKSATVTGLAPGLYYFRVRAINAVGTGSFSSASAGITIPEPE